MKYREFRLSLCLFGIYVSILSYFAYGYREVFPTAESSTPNLSALSNMKQKTNKNRVKPEVQYGSRTVGEILLENQLFKDIYPNTELGVDLKLLTRNPGRLPVGVPVDGSIVNDGDDHFTFVENAFRGKKVGVRRNPIFIRGTFVNVHVKEDGSVYPTFNRPNLDKDLSFETFCRGAAKELLYYSQISNLN